MNEEQRHEVCKVERAPGLYLTDWVGASSVSESNILDITHIFSVLSDDELEQYGPETEDGVQLRHLALKDDPSEDILPFLTRECDFIESVISHTDGGRGGSLLVHCQQGISRSTAFVVAYLMRKHRLSYDDAIRLVKNDRSIAQPNLGFEEQLRLWEECDYSIYVEGKVGMMKEQYKNWKRDQEGMRTPTNTSPKTPKTPKTPIHEIDSRTGSSVIDMVERLGVWAEDEED